MKMINVNSNFIKKLNNITNKSKKVYKNENDFSFMDSIEKLISQNEKLTSESMNSLPDISTNHWPNLIKEKKKNIKNKIKNYFEQKNKNQTITKIQRGRFTTPKDLKMEGLSSPKKEYNRTPKNFSSKKIQIRISKSNNINKKHLNESLEKKNKIEFSILESHRKKHFGSSHKKNKIDRRERMKSELPNINVKLQKIEKKFSTRFSNCLPFPEKLYKLLGVLGKGSYGLVFLAVHLISGEKVAIKAIKKNRNNDMARNYEKITNEIEIFSKLNHKNIISLYEVFENRKYIFLVTEYAEKGI